MDEDIDEYIVPMGDYQGQTKKGVTQFWVSDTDYIIDTPHELITLNLDCRVVVYELGVEVMLIH